MVWALRNVFMLIPDSTWEPGGRIDPPAAPQPFDAYSARALRVSCPFAIVRTRVSPPRRRRTRAA